MRIGRELTDEVRRVLRFGIGSMAIEATSFLPPGPQRPFWSVVALLLTAALTGLSIVMPPVDRPRPARIALVALIAGILVALRTGAGSGTPISAAAVLLPLVWIALHFSNAVLRTATGIGALVLIASGPMTRPGSPERLWHLQSSGMTVQSIEVLLVAVIVCPAIRRLVTEERSRATEVQTFADAFRSLADVVDARGDICMIVARATGATRVILAEPEPGAGLVSTASNVTDEPVLHLAMDRPSTSVQAFRSGQRILLSDTRTARPEMRAHLRSKGIASTITQPVLRAGVPVAVLSLHFETPLRRVPDGMGRLLDILATGAASAIGRVAALERLAVSASTDPLTGLANRRSWHERIHVDGALAARSGAALTIAMIDLDHFKDYNDRHGHLAGDGLLVEFAARIRAIARTGDTVARWGGEEFALLLPGSDLDGAAALGARLLTAVPDGQTCSIGLAQWLPGESDDQWLGRADRALFRAKAAGRGRLEVDRTPAHRLAADLLADRPGAQAVRSRAGTSPGRS